jgi:putative glutathione S-transferase
LLTNNPTKALSNGDAFRDWVSADGSTPYPAVAGRYHLYVSLACPWASRTVIVRHLLGLEWPSA